MRIQRRRRLVPDFPVGSSMSGGSLAGAAKDASTDASSTAASNPSLRLSAALSDPSTGASTGGLQVGQVLFFDRSAGIFNFVVGELIRVLSSTGGVSSLPRSMSASAPSSSAA